VIAALWVRLSWWSANTIEPKGTSYSPVENGRHENALEVGDLNRQHDCSSNGILHMKSLFPKAEVQALCSALAALLLLSTIPLSYGAVIISSPSQPQFTINICSPLQSIDHAPQTLLARPATDSSWFEPFLTGPVTANLVIPEVGPSIRPETPPPKQLS
jgi:hypothetical protein